MQSIGITGLTHFFIGVVIALVPVVFSYRKGTRRRMFRFNGNDKLSLGTKESWLKYLSLALVLEIFSSFIPGFSQYPVGVEVALSIIEAPLLVAGFFAVDRVAVWLEPSSHFESNTTKSKGPTILSSTQSLNQTREIEKTEAIIDEISSATASTPTPITPSVSSDKEPSALSEKASEAAQAVAGSAASAAGILVSLPQRIKDTVHSQHEEARLRREAEEKTREAESDRRRSNLKKSIEGF